MTVSEWADAHRVLSSESSAEPGQWNTARAEYQREVMDALGDRRIECVVAMLASQLGKTEIVNNSIGYTMHLRPGPMMLMQPTVEMAKAWSKDRLEPMLRDTPVLRGLVKPSKSRDSGNTVLHKRFTGGQISVVGANSPAGLASRPICFFYADEIDRNPPSAKEEGTPDRLGWKRTMAFPGRRKGLFISTPTIKGESRIEALYLDTDQRKYYVPCPHCGHEQILHWEQVQWEKGPDGNHMPETARYVCESCEQGWTDAQRWGAVNRGRWKPTAVPKNPKWRGYHLSAIAGTWVYLSDMVHTFLAAQGDIGQMQVFANTELAETWEEAASQANHSILMARQEAYTPENIPDAALVLTAGVDTQDDRLEVSVIGWGVGRESWTVEHKIFYGDPAQPAVWQQLDEFLQSVYTTEAGRRLGISAACIDTAGHHSDSAYQYTKGKQGRRIYGIVGRSGNRPVWSNRATKNRRGGQLYTVGVDAAKEFAIASLKISEPGAGYCHFPAGLDEEFFLQLTSEVRRTKFIRGRAYSEWVAKRPRNETWDCRIYAFAALASLNPDWASLAANTDRVLRALEESEPVEREKPDAMALEKKIMRRQPRFKPRGKSFSRY